MHPYATNSNKRNVVLFILAVASVFAAWALSQLINQLNVGAIIWWLEIPSVWGFFGLFYLWFDRVLWRSSIVRNVGLVAVPNLNGLWIGHIKSSFDNYETEYPATLKICQTWSKISIVLDLESSRSESQIAGIIINSHKETFITYEYLSEPKAHAVETMQIHRGTTKFMYRPGNDGLEGEYYTGRGRQNFGALYFERSKG